MNTLQLLSFIAYALVALSALATAAVYSTRKEFMSYHAATVGQSWSEVGDGMQLLVITMMRAMAGGWLAATIAVVVLLLLPFRSGEAWANWTIFAINLTFLAPGIFGIPKIRSRTPGRPPLSPLAAVALTIAGLVLGLAA